MIILKNVYILLLIIIVIIFISFVRLYMNNKQLAKKRLRRLIIYLILVFITYKITYSIFGDYFLIPLIPALLYIPFLYFDYINKNKD